MKFFKIAVAPFLPVLVKLVKNIHFYNVDLAQNLFLGCQIELILSLYVQALFLNTHIAMTTGQTHMPVMGIHGKSLNLQTQP